MEYLVYFREIFIKNFNVSINAIEKNKFKINQNLAFHIFRFIPFILVKFISNMFKINLIYNIDNIYFSNHNNSFSIKPVLIEFEIYKESIRLSILSNLRNYDLNVPFWFFLKNEKLEDYTHIKLKYIQQGKIQIKEILIENMKDKLLVNIFD